MLVNRRILLGLLASTAMAAVVRPAPTYARAQREPNFIIILCDDLGYGDIEPTRGKTIPTPNLQKYPQLYDIAADPSESYSVHQRYPEILAEMRKKLAEARATFAPFKRGIPAFAIPARGSPPSRQD